MRSPSAFDWTCCVAAILAVSLLSSPALAADEKKACSVAYDQTQALRTAGKLSAARQQTLVCMRDVCASFVRTDCTKWLGEIDSSQPTVVFEVRDASGKDTSAVHVVLDGKPWLDKLDVTAVAIDPGDHTIRYEIDGASPHEDTVRIREGDKNRKLAFSFQPAKPVEPPKPPPEPPPRSVVPWVVGGVGVVGLVVGGIFGGLTLAAKSTVNGGCNDAAMTCSSSAHSAAERGKAFGDVTTIGLIVGGLGVATSVVLFATGMPKTSGATVGMGPIAAPGTGGWHIQGSF